MNPLVNRRKRLTEVGTGPVGDRFRLPIKYPCDWLIVDGQNMSLSTKVELRLNQSCLACEVERDGKRVALPWVDSVLFFSASGLPIHLL
jgi:hypothetical protein